MRRAYTIGAPSVFVSKNGLGQFPEFRDQGVGGSNPLSPTISFKYFRNRRVIEDFQKDLHSRRRYGLRQKLAPDRRGSHAHSFNSLFPPGAVVNGCRLE